MILNIFPKLTKIAVLDGAPDRLCVRKALLSYTEADGAKLEFLNERVVSYDGHDYDVILRHRKGKYEILLRRR